MQQNCAQISKYIRHTRSMLFAQFVNLNDSPQTKGHLFSWLLRKKFLYKTSRGSIGKAFNEPEDNSPHLKEKIAAN